MKVLVNGLNVYFEAFGGGPPLVLLHGWGANHLIWQNLLPHLTAYTYQYLALDLPGFGQSGPLPKPFNTNDYAEVVAGFIQELELKEPTLLGHSLGGKIALSYALDHPLKKLILIDSAGIKRRSLRTKTILLAARFLKLINNQQLNSFLLPLKSSWQSADYRQIEEGTLRHTFRLIVEEDFENQLQRIKVPTLLVWGSNDPETPLRDAAIMKREIINSQLKVIPESGHFPFLDHPQVVARLIGDFLKQP